MSVKKKRKRKPRVVDLFAGAGLFSYSFQREGFELVLAVEQDKVASDTYRKNLGDHLIQDDIRNVEPSGHCDVLIGGPPCQGFSTLGKRNENDQRNFLSHEVVKWAKKLKPKIVIIENVQAFIRSIVWKEISKELQDDGFDVKAFVLNAHHFGVPQLRVRSFTVASKVGFPVIKQSGKKLTVREAWKGLPKEPDGENQHYSPTPSEIALQRMKIIPPGGDKRDVLRLAPQLAAPSWWSVKNEVTDVWGRMIWDKPCNTLRTCLQNASKGRYIHPEQNRVISLREAARLHSIPDSWSFSGLPTQIARQIGNSVPPSLGRSVAKSIRELLN